MKGPLWLEWMDENDDEGDWWLSVWGRTSALNLPADCTKYELLAAARVALPGLRAAQHRDRLQVDKENREL